MKFLALSIACLYLATSWAVAGFILNPYRYVVAGGGSDPSFASVVALLHFDGSNGSTTITDSSSAANTFTVSGNAQLTTTGPKFGSACLTLDGSGDDVYAADDADWNLSTNNWTIEGWAYPDSASAAQTVLAQWGAGGNAFFFGVGTGYGLFLNSGLIVGYSSWPSASNWHHWAAVRNGVNVSLYINGTIVGSPVNISSGAITNSNETLRIGRDNGGNPYFSGKMDDIRITNGVARYTSNFTAPTAAHPDS